MTDQEVYDDSTGDIHLSEEAESDQDTGDIHLTKPEVSDHATSGIHWPDEVSSKLLDHVFRLIENVVKFQKEDLDPAIFAEFKKTKKLTRSFIDAAWATDGTNAIPENKDSILVHLDRRGLIVKPLPEEGETEVDYYIAPCLLDEAKPQEVRPLLEVKGTKITSTLCFDFLGKSIPPAVNNDILAACIHRFQILSDHGTQILQQGLGCFVIRNGQWKLVFHCKDSQLKVTMFSDRAGDVQAGDGHNIRVIIEAIIKATLERNQQNHLDFRYLISDDFEVDETEEMTSVETASSTPGEAGHRPIKYTVWFSEPVSIVHVCRYIFMFVNHETKCNLSE